jgi:hypothetical protein
MEVYIVTTGSYSDYSIVRVYLDESLAEEYVRLRGEEYRVEEFDVTEKTPEILEVHTRRIEVHAESGDVLTDYAYSTTHEDSEAFWQEDEVRSKGLVCERGETHGLRGQDGSWALPPRVLIDVRSTDLERATKVAGDKLAQERARILGL